MKISLLKTTKSEISGEYVATTMEELSKILCSVAWSPFLFSSGRRVASDMVSCDVFALDIDGGMALDRAIERVKLLGLAAIVGTSKSHQIEKNGVICDRFRLVFRLGAEVNDKETVRNLFESLRILFPASDISCKDAARFFYPCKEIVYVQEGLSYVPPQGIPLTLSKRSFTIINQGAPQGERNEALISIVHDAMQQKWTQEDLIECLSASDHAWLYDDTAKGKIAERYENFVPTHEARLPANVALSPSGAPISLKSKAIPVMFLKPMLHKWLDENEFRCTYSGSVFMGESSRELTVDDLFPLFLIYCAETNQLVNDSVVKALLNEWINDRRDIHREIIARNFTSFNKEEGTAELVKFLRVFKAETTDTDIAVMRHMLWQIKRKLFGLSTSTEMMFVMVGGQGTGKSYGLRNYLLKPLSDLAFNGATFSMLSDPREAMIFNEHFALVFDEMTGAQKSDVEHIKQLITSQSLKVRRMYTTKHAVARVNATLFGTSNKALSTIIRDETGMRRFWEFVVDDRAMVVPKWQQLDAIDYNLLWSCVDKDEPCFISEVYEELAKAQESLRTESTTDNLLSLGILELDETARTKFQDLYKVYNMYSPYKKHISLISRELKEGLPHKRTSKENYFQVRIVHNDEF